MTTGDWTRREFFRKSTIVGAAVVGGSALLSACSKTSSGSGDTLSAAKKNGTIKIGIAGEQPYGYTDPKTNQVTGEAPEVARAIFRKLGVNKVQATQVDFNQLIPGLNAGNYDMVCAGMDITPPRCKQAQFSIPDYTALVAFLVPKGNPRNVLNFDDVKSKNVKIAVESGAVEASYATSAGVSSGLITPFETPDEMLQAVTSGRAYAAVLTDISLNTLVKQNGGAPVEVTKGFEPVINGKKQGETGGFVFRKNDTDLVNQFNDQLKQMHSNGEWLKVVAPFGFSQANIPAPDVTTQSLCSAS